ncbi:hypothetical protein D3C75_1371850 [compost metagenome]
MGFAVAHGQAHKNPQHLGVALCGQQAVVTEKAHRIDVGATDQVVTEQRHAQGFGYITPGVFEQ